MGLRCDIYIGSDNGSRIIGQEYLERIVEWASSNFPEGYTIVRGRGYFGGFEEDSVILSFLTDHDFDPNGRIEELKRKLNQDSILVSKYPVKLETV